MVVVHKHVVMSTEQHPERCVGAPFDASPVLAMIGRYPSAIGIKLAATCHDLTLQTKQGCIGQPRKTGKLSKFDVIRRDPARSPWRSSSVQSSFTRTSAL